MYLRNVDDVRRYVETFCREMSYTDNIGDLSLLSNEGLSVLLKFVEEGVQNLVCYASRDNISQVLMSRFDKIEKYEDIKVGNGDFSDFIKEMSEKEKVDCIEREFVAIAGSCLDSFILYRKLNKGAISRIGELI
jgi:hypothetical protein